MMATNGSKSGSTQQPPAHKSGVKAQAGNGAGIDSVRIRASNDGAGEVFVEVAVLDPKKPRELELVIVRKDAPDAWALVDMNDLLSALQVIRPRGGES